MGFLSFFLFSHIRSTYGCANDCCMDACSIQFIAILAVTVGLKLLGPIWRLLKIDQVVISAAAYRGC